MKKNVSTIFFILVLLLVLYLAGLVVWPYLSYLILAIVIAYAARPLYLRINSWLKRPNLSSAIMVVLVLVLLFLPAIFLLRSLVNQGASAILSFDSSTINNVSGFLSERFGINLDIGFVVEMSTTKIKQFLVNESINVLTGIADILVGIVIMFFVLFFAFRDGEVIYRSFVELLPLQASYKEVLFGEMQIVTNAVIYGQIVIALIQGLFGGLAFAIFGLPNAAFWGFVMAIISFLPVVGTPIVFIPAGIVQLLQGNAIAGIGVIGVGLLMVMNVDSVVKPLIISERSRLNAALILIGVIGGLKAFGFMGFILGPLVLALLFALLKVYRQDFKPSAALTEASKKVKSDVLIIPLHQRPPDAHRQDRQKGGGSAP